MENTLWKISSLFGHSTVVPTMTGQHVRREHRPFLADALFGHDLDWFRRKGSPVGRGLIYIDNKIVQFRVVDALHKLEFAAVVLARGDFPVSAFFSLRTRMVPVIVPPWLDCDKINPGE